MSPHDIMYCMFVLNEFLKVVPRSERWVFEDLHREAIRILEEQYERVYGCSPEERDLHL